MTIKGVRQRAGDVRAQQMIIEEEQVLGTAIFRFGSRILTAILLLGLLVVAGSASNPVSGPKAEGGFQTSAPYAILIDAATGTVLFEKGADTPTPPSSLAKLMTAEIIFDEITQGKLSRDEEFIISENAWHLEHVCAHP